MRVLLLALAVLLALPGAAAAHVTVVPDISRPGQTAELTFRVPNERDDAATVQVDVFLPPGVPAEIRPHAGWTQTRVGDEVRWTADDGVSIRPGRTAEFKVRLGPLPEQPEIVFKALQHYADGQVVRWIQPPAKDAERPAAVLDLGGRVRSESASGTSPLIAAGLLGLIIIAALIVWRRRRV